VLQLSETITLFAICGRHTSIISKDRQVDTWCLGAPLIYTGCTGRGQDGTLWCLCFPWHFVFNGNSEFSVYKERDNKLDYADRKL
jgi:hypothetical protein